MHFSEKEKERYLRQITLEDLGYDGQLKLKNASVLCVGGGGLGSPLCLYLAAIGVGKIGIMDKDVVSLNNLSRQILFSEEDIGKNKATVLANKLSKQFPDITFLSYEYFFTQENVETDLLPFDIIADCADNIETTYLIDSYCRVLKKSFSYASVSGFKGQCLYLKPEDTWCFRCLFPKDLLHFTPITCNQGIIATTVGFFAMLQANEIIKAILGISQSAPFITFDMKTLDMKLLSFDSYHTCKHTSLIKTDHDIEITGDELLSLLKTNKPVVLLDVRSFEEHKENSLHSLCIPLDKLLNEPVHLDPSQQYVIYCQEGTRSFYAAHFLKSISFKHVKHLTGGMKRWQIALQDVMINL